MIDKLKHMREELARQRDQLVVNANMQIGRMNGKVEMLDTIIALMEGEQAGANASDNGLSHPDSVSVAGQ